MIKFPEKDFYNWDDFLEVVRLLRSENGCPWDKIQTHASIRRNFLEETYEALDAIDRDSLEDMREELGDVILQCAFHAQIERERNRFAMPDVIDAVTKKLLYRHPHVFGEVFHQDYSQDNNQDNNQENNQNFQNNIETAIINGEKKPIENIERDLNPPDAGKAVGTWEARKRREKGHNLTADAIESVPHTLPALWRTEKIQKKVASAGFDWENISDALEKLEEEVGELREAVEKFEKSPENQRDLNISHGIREEVGDALFMATKIAQFYHIDPEDALHNTCDKFERRFRLVETAADKPLSDYSQDELDMLWNNAKKQEKI